jgi:uncharacterized membrane protein
MPSPAGALSLEHSIGRFLMVAIVAGVVALAIGVAAMALGGISPTDPTPAFDLAAVPDRIAHLEPDGLLWVGLLVVIATPPLRVAAALVGYAGRRERGMAFVAVAILGVIAVGIAVGLAAG